MRAATITAAILIGLAGACDRTPATEVVAAPSADPRPLIAEISALEVTQTPGAAIVRATGLAPLQGHFDGALVPLPAPAAGTLAFAFRVQPPPGATRVSTPRSREVTVAVGIPATDLTGIREIRVAGAANSRAVRR